MTDAPRQDTLAAEAALALGPALSPTRLLWRRFLDHRLAVGSAILLEVFLGILLNCKDTFLKDKKFKLNECIAPDPKNFQLADIVRFVN